MKWIEPTQTGSTYPSLGDLEEAHFACKAFGDLALWSANPWMTWGEGKPEADPDRSAVVAAFQVTFIQGGFVFSMHSHHYASDVMGWHNFTHQLAENCYAVSNGTTFPPWDAARIDVSRFTLDIPESDQVDGPPAAPKASRHPDQQALLFHLPQRKATLLKELAFPTDKSLRISTYDAMCAFVWRQLSRIRQPFYNLDPSTKPFFGEAVNMRPRLHDPELPERMLRNVLCGAFGNLAPVSCPTIKDVVAPEQEYPLRELALYIRKLTNSCDQKHMEALLKSIAPVRDKRSVSLSLDALPPMSIWVTDHRSADVGGLDFGFGKPITYRHLWGEHLSPGLILIYAPIKSSSKPDEGFVFTITMEKELVPRLLQDPDWTNFFEYLGED